VIPPNNIILESANQTTKNPNALFYPRPLQCLEAILRPSHLLPIFSTILNLNTRVLVCQQLANDGLTAKNKIFYHASGRNF